MRLSQRLHFVTVTKNQWASPTCDATKLIHGHARWSIVSTQQSSRQHHFGDLTPIPLTTSYFRASDPAAAGLATHLVGQFSAENWPTGSPT
jgi:hypothetical protein